MAPQYVFRIDEFTEHPDAVQQYDREGKWIPTALAGYNIRRTGGASYQWWCCDGQRIYPIADLPAESTYYKTFSTVFSGGHGFWVLRGDATAPAADETWHYLMFNHDDNDYSSSLTNAGTHCVLRCHDPNRRWPAMLLPDIYHGSISTHHSFGGLTGDLPIFLALVAFSMRPERLLQELPRLMQGGDWGTHTRSHGRTDKRGVIVSVYTVNGNAEELNKLENGMWGKYYN